MANAALTQDFRDLLPPGELVVRVMAKGSAKPLDARVTIETGEKPLIAYFGKTTFFTELDAPGHISLPLAPGAYRFKVATAEGFRAKASYFAVSVAAASRKTVDVTINFAADPAAQGWYAGDMHHHSDVLDGFTEARYVLRSELAAGLDITLLSDHDSVINNPEMSRLARARGVPFIAASEFSPSWAHFNAYPLDADKDIAIDSGRSTVQQIFAEARRMGAAIIQVNHPYIAYGYFRSRELNAIPGGYSDAFDLVEISSIYENESTIAHVWEQWNVGRKIYFTAGSDAHDVWREVSGAARMMVKVEGELTVAGFVSALQQGRSYATLGPLIYPQLMFGETVRHAPGTPLALNFSVQSVNGLKSVALIERGQNVETRSFSQPTDLTAVNFATTPRGNTWYSLVVEDAAGKHAYTNPIWVAAD